MAKNKGKKKGKKNNPYGGEKGRKKNNPYGGNKGSLKVNPSNYQSKSSKQAYIAQVISDGRVSQSEAKNAAALGITDYRLNKAQDKSFVPGNVFSRPETTPAPPTAKEVAMGTYNPPTLIPTNLIIGNKAKAILPTYGGTPAVTGPGDDNTNTGNNNDSGNTGEVSNNDIDVGVDDYDPFTYFMENSFPVILDSLKPKEYEPLPLPSMYSSIGQAAQSAPGVKARRSAASRRMASTLGTRGAFNRGGLRISNLNI